MEIPNNCPGVFLDAHQIMPNHMHGILVIDKPNGGDGFVGGAVGGTVIGGTQVVDPADHSTGVPAGNRTEQASQRWKPQSVGVIINQYKRKCTIDAWKINPNFMTILSATTRNFNASGITLSTILKIGIRIR